MRLDLWNLALHVPLEETTNRRFRKNKKFRHKRNFLLSAVYRLLSCFMVMCEKSRQRVPMDLGRIRSMAAPTFVCVDCGVTFEPPEGYKHTRKPRCKVCDPKGYPAEHTPDELSARHLGAVSLSTRKVQANSRVCPGRPARHSRRVPV